MTDNCAGQLFDQHLSFTMTKDFTPFDWVVLAFITLFFALGFLHIAFGLSSVVAVLSSPNAAGWVQAVGAIGAIGIAIWVANRSDRVAANSARIATKHFIAMAEAGIGGLYVASGISSEEADVQKARFLGELKEVQLIGQGIQIGQLHPALCELLLAARTTVGRSIDLGIDIRTRTQWHTDLDTALRSTPRDGHTIALALIKSSWETMKALKESSTRH